MKQEYFNPLASKVVKYNQKKEEQIKSCDDCNESIEKKGALYCKMKLKDPEDENCYNDSSRAMIKEECKYFRKKI